MAQLLALPLARITDANENPLSGAKLYPYLSGGTTPTPVYTTDELNTAHAHPVVADAFGLLPPIYLDPAITYRFKAKTSAGADIDGMDFDPVSIASSGDVQFTASGTGAVVRTAQARLDDTRHLLDFIPVAYHTAIKNYSSTVDVTSYIEAAIAATGNSGTLYVPAGWYRHTGFTLSKNINIRGAGLLATFLENLSDNPSIQVIRDAGFGSILQCGLFDFSLYGDPAASAAQHGIVIDGVSSGYPVQNVRVAYHGGDGVRIRHGCTGPMLTNLVSTLNTGWGVNITSKDEDPGALNATSTSGRFLNYAITNNTEGGIRLNGGDTQDNYFYVFQTGIVESNNVGGSNGGILLLNGNIGSSFRDVWIENNGDYGIFCTANGAGAGQVPLRMMFENIYFADHDVYPIYVESGQEGSWKNLFAYSVGLTAYFTDSTNASSHTIQGTFPTFAVGGEGREVRRIHGVIGETFLRITPGVLTNLLYMGADTVKWTSGSGTPEGAVTAAVGSLYTRTNGGANTTLYVKESGTGNTGWVAK